LARTDAGLVELFRFFYRHLEAELTDAPKAEGITPAARQSMLEHQYPGHTFAVLTPAAICLQLPRFCRAPFSALTPSRIRSSLRRWCSHASLHSLCHPNRSVLFAANMAALVATREPFPLPEIPTIS